MIKNIFLFCIVFCFEVISMNSISINVQGINGRQFIAQVIETNNPVISLRNTLENRSGSNSISLTKDGVFTVILNKETFEQQSVKIEDFEHKKILCYIAIEKSDFNCQPKIKLIKGTLDNIHCSLCRQRAGGGNAFIFTMGDTTDSVSLQTVINNQFLKGQALALISQL